MASGTLKARNDIAIGKIQLGTTQTFNANEFFAIDFQSDTISSILGVVGYSLEDRSQAKNVAISAIVAISSNTVRMLGQCINSASIPNIAYVNVMYRVNRIQ